MRGSHPKGGGSLGFTGVLQALIDESPGTGNEGIKCQHRSPTINARLALARSTLWENPGNWSATTAVPATKQRKSRRFTQRKRKRRRQPSRQRKKQRRTMAHLPLMEEYGIPLVSARTGERRGRGCGLTAAPAAARSLSAMKPRQPHPVPTAETLRWCRVNFPAYCVRISSFHSSPAKRMP